MQRRLIVVALTLVGFMVVGVRAAQADVCIHGAVNYQLQIGTANPSAGTPIVISGTRVGAARTPVSGALSVSGAVIRFGIDEQFDWGSGLWIHPDGTTVLSFNTSTSVFTFDTTFHGAGTPNNVKGTATFIACPVAVTPSSADPNNK